jgi:hypothetical protein
MLVGTKARFFIVTWTAPAAPPPELAGALDDDDDALKAGPELELELELEPQPAMRSANRHRARGADRIMAAEPISCHRSAA